MMLTILIHPYQTVSLINLAHINLFLKLKNFIVNKFIKFFNLKRKFLLLSRLVIILKRWEGKVSLIILRAMGRWSLKLRTIKLAKMRLVRRRMNGQTVILSLARNSGYQAPSELILALSLNTDFFYDRPYIQQSQTSDYLFIIFQSFVNNYLKKKNQMIVFC